MTNEFVYESKFGTTYNDCFIKVDKKMFKDPNIIRLQLISHSEGPVTVITIGSIDENIKTTKKELIIKDYSENEGIYEWLIEQKLVRHGVPFGLPPFGAKCWFCTPTDKLLEIIEGDQ